MKVLLHAAIVFIGCNTYLIGLALYLLARPGRKRDHDGNLIMDDGSIRKRGT